ncbi:MAG: diacylglycerol kinase family lipid kinase [Verrucomicrobia bacterium]|nr:diacylglycerol kinase family lipid kinase [Verrucomicrobiota bacterium]
MPRIFVIFNPAARGEKSQRLRRFLESKAGPDVTLAPTERAGDATRLAAEADGIVVAAGGDGTINEVVNGLRLPGATLGVLPLGTANVFARELGIPLDLAAAWATLERGVTRVIDLGVAEFAGRQRFFAQLAGVGFDARAVRTANWELKKRFGPLSYVWAGLAALREQKDDVAVVAEDTGDTARGMAVMVGNGRRYGGPFRLFPDAQLDDGLLDVCVFERGGYGNALRHGFGVLCGRHTQQRGVRCFRSARFVCRAASPAPLELDGEDAGDVPVLFRLEPRALRVIAPV